MAYDVLTKKQSGRDWSLGFELDRQTSEKIAPALTIGVLGFGIWMLANQPKSHELQSRHFRAWKSGR
jgi:hypothetical protein